MSLFDQQNTFLHTRDLAVTARFYEDALGLPMERDQGDCRSCPNGCLLEIQRFERGIG